MSFWSTFHWTSLSSQSSHGVVLGWTIPNIEEPFPLGGPGSTVTKLPDHAAVVAVVDGRVISEIILFKYFQDCTWSHLI